VLRRFLIASLAAVIAAGCANPWYGPGRTVYRGVGKGDGFGGGTLAINIDGVQYSGEVIQTRPNESLGFIQSRGSDGTTRPGTGGFLGRYEGILSSAGNRALRCDLRGDGAGHLGGLCVDDRGRRAESIFRLVFFVMIRSA
jgi:hypothetical protein